MDHFKALALRPHVTFKAFELLFSGQLTFLSQQIQNAPLPSCSSEVIHFCGLELEHQKWITSDLGLQDLGTLQFWGFGSVGSGLATL